MHFVMCGTHVTGSTPGLIKLDETETEGCSHQQSCLDRDPMTLLLPSPVTAQVAAQRQPAKVARSAPTG